MAKNLPSNAGDEASIPGRATKPAGHSYRAHALWSSCATIREKPRVSMCASTKTRCCDSLVDFGFLLVFLFLGLLALFLASMFAEFTGSEGQRDAAHGSVPGLFSLHFSRSAFASGTAFLRFPASCPVLHDTTQATRSFPIRGPVLSSLCLSAFAHAVSMLFLLLECSFSSSFP